MRAAVCALAALVLVAGCGSNGGGETGGQLSHSEYEQQLQAVGADVKAAMSGPSVSDDKTPAEIADQVEALRKRLKSAADDIDALSPPDDARFDNDELARTLHQFDGAFAALADAVRTMDVAGAQAASKDLQDAASDAEDAVRALEAKGYDLGDLGSR